MISDILLIILAYILFICVVIAWNTVVVLLFLAAAEFYRDEKGYSIVSGIFGILLVFIEIILICLMLGI